MPILPYRRHRLREGERSELVCYARRGKGLKMKAISSVLQDQGRTMDKDHAMTMHDKLLKLLDMSDEIFDFLDRTRALAYTDVMETLLCRLNFWLHADTGFWQKLSDKNRLFGPLVEGRSGCGYATICDFWVLSRDLLQWKIDIIDKAMRRAEDAYLAEMKEEGVEMSPDEFRKQIYIYVTKERRLMGSNAVGHEFGNALESTLSVSGKVKLLENVPWSGITHRRRQDLMAKLQALNSPPTSIEDAFRLQKHFLTLCLTKKCEDHSEHSPPPRKKHKGD